MGLGRHALGQGEFHGGQYGLLIVLQDERENIDHLPVSTRTAQHLILQLPEGHGQFREGCPVPQRPGFRWMTAR